MREEGAKPAFAEYGEAKVGRGPARVRTASLGANLIVTAVTGRARTLAGQRVAKTPSP